MFTNYHFDYLKASLEKANKTVQQINDLISENGEDSIHFYYLGGINSDNVLHNYLIPENQDLMKAICERTGDEFFGINISLKEILKYTKKVRDIISTDLKKLFPDETPSNLVTLDKGVLTDRVLFYAPKVGLKKPDKDFSKKANLIFSKIINEGLNTTFGSVKGTLYRNGFYSGKRKLS